LRGAFLMQILLGARDRHDGNCMITLDCMVMNIDYGHFLDDYATLTEGITPFANRRYTTMMNSFLDEYLERHPDDSIKKQFIDGLFDDLTRLKKHMNPSGIADDFKLEFFGSSAADRNDQKEWLKEVKVPRGGYGLIEFIKWTLIKEHSWYRPRFIKTGGKGQQKKDNLEALKSLMQEDIGKVDGKIRNHIDKWTNVRDGSAFYDGKYQNYMKVFGTEEKTFPAGTKKGTKKMVLSCDANKRDQSSTFPQCSILNHNRQKCSQCLCRDHGIINTPGNCNFLGTWRCARAS